MKDKAAVVEVAARTNNVTVPVLLKFQNGELATVVKHSTQFCRTKRPNEDSTNALVVANGETYNGEIKSDELTDNYICVRNRDTNKVRIIPLDVAKLSNSIYSKLEEKSKTQLKEVSKNELIKKFGGRKAMRYINDSEKSKINIDSVKDNLNEMVSSATLTEEQAETAGTDHYNRIRPNFNANAEKLSEIYNIYDVVPEELLDRMEEEAKAVSTVPVDKLPISSKFLCDCLTRVQQETPSKSRELKIKIILYMDCLLNLIKSRSRSLGSVELSGITEKVENDVRSRFCDSTVRKFSKTPLTTEKAFCYFLVLALLISENYQVDINLLKTELSAAKAKIIKYANIISARCKFNSDILTLCLPSKMKPLATKNFRKSNK